MKTGTIKQSNVLGRWMHFLSLPFWAGLTVFLMAPAVSISQTPVNLRTTANFSILANTTITSTGGGTIEQSLGLSPGTSVTGIVAGDVGGEWHVADDVAATAQTDLLAAYNDAVGRSGFVSIAAAIGDITILPGVYEAASSLGITGTLTLDGQSNPDAVWIFKMGSTLTTASYSDVILIDGANACNVFWAVGSSATLGTYSNFKGSILALVSITDNTGASVEGRLLAHTGAVTFDGTTVNASCGTPISLRLSALEAIFADAGTVDVRWTAEQEAGVAGYNVYRAWQEFEEYTKISERIIMALDDAAAPHRYCFQDGTAEQGKPYFYKVESVQLDGTSEWHGPVSPSGSAAVENQRLPESFRLMPVYPNPFNPQTTIQYELPQDAEITLTVFDIQGREAAVLVHEYQRSGAYHSTWNPCQEQAGGLYFIVMRAGEQVLKQKASYVK